MQIALFFWGGGNSLIIKELPKAQNESTSIELTVASADETGCTFQISGATLNENGTELSGTAGAEVTITTPTLATGKALGIMLGNTQLRPTSIVQGKPVYSFTLTEDIYGEELMLMFDNAVIRVNEVDFLDAASAFTILNDEANNVSLLSDITWANADAPSKPVTVNGQGHKITISTLYAKADMAFENVEFNANYLMGDGHKLVFGENNSGTVKYTYGGGNKTNIESSLLEIHSGNFTNVFGGGYGSDSNVDNTKVNIFGGVIQFLCGGAYQGAAGTTTLNVSGGTLTAIYGGSCSGTVGVEQANTTITGGTITQIYGGGYLSPAKIINLNIAGGTINSVFGGSAKSSSEKVNLTLTAFTGVTTSTGVKQALIFGGGYDSTEGDVRIEVKDLNPGADNKGDYLFIYGAGKATCATVDINVHDCDFSSLGTVDINGSGYGTTATPNNNGKVTGNVNITATNVKYPYFCIKGASGSPFSPVEGDVTISVKDCSPIPNGSYAYIEPTVEIRKGHKEEDIPGLLQSSIGGSATINVDNTRVSSIMYDAAINGGITLNLKSNSIVTAVDAPVTVNSERLIDSRGFALRIQRSMSIPDDELTFVPVNADFPDDQITLYWYPSSEEGSTDLMRFGNVYYIPNDIPELAAAPAGIEYEIPEDTWKLIDNHVRVIPGTTVGINVNEEEAESEISLMLNDEELLPGSDGTFSFGMPRENASLKATYYVNTTVTCDNEKLIPNPVETIVLSIPRGVTVDSSRLKVLYSAPGITTFTLSDGDEVAVKEVSIDNDNNKATITLAEPATTNGYYTVHLDKGALTWADGDKQRGNKGMDVNAFQIDTPTSVNDLSAEDCQIHYYTLDGIAVDPTALTSGFYIRVNGSRAEKIFIR